MHNIIWNKTLLSLCARITSPLCAHAVFSLFLFSRFLLGLFSYNIMWGRCFYTRTRALNHGSWLWLHVDRNVRASVLWGSPFFALAIEFSYAIFAHAERICFLYIYTYYMCIHIYNPLSLGPPKSQYIWMRAPPEEKSCLTHQAYRRSEKLSGGTYQCPIVIFSRRNFIQCGQCNNFFQINILFVIYLYVALFMIGLNNDSAIFSKFVCSVDFYWHAILSAENIQRLDCK